MRFWGTGDSFGWAGKALLSLISYCSASYVQYINIYEVLIKMSMVRRACRFWTTGWCHI